MKKNILVQTGTRTEQRTRIIPATYDEEGSIIAEEYTEEYDVEVPIMESVYADMTAEEIAELESMEIPQEEPTQLDRIEAQAMYTALMTDTLIEEG